VWRRAGQFSTLGLTERLEGEDVVPGFSLVVSAVFADPMG
jgi:hypothetical protein